jgi:hypothetical protein
MRGRRRGSPSGCGWPAVTQTAKRTVRVGLHTANARASISAPIAKNLYKPTYPPYTAAQHAPYTAGLSFAVKGPHVHQRYVVHRFHTRARCQQRQQQDQRNGQNRCSQRHHGRYCRHGPSNGGPQEGQKPSLQPAGRAFQCANANPARVKRTRPNHRPAHQPARLTAHARVLKSDLCAYISCTRSYL